MKGYAPTQADSGSRTVALPNNCRLARRENAAWIGVVRDWAPRALTRAPDQNCLAIRVRNSRNADQVAPREAAWLLRQTIEPFEPPSLHPGHRARHIAGKEIEQGPDANAEGAPCRRQMLLDEQLLLGIAHRHKQDVGLRLGE